MAERDSCYAHLRMVGRHYTYVKKIYPVVRTFIASVTVDIHQMTEYLVVHAQCFPLLPTCLFTTRQQLASNEVTTVHTSPNRATYSHCHNITHLYECVKCTDGSNN